MKIARFAVFGLAFSLYSGNAHAEAAPASDDFSIPLPAANGLSVLNDNQETLNQELRHQAMLGHTREIDRLIKQGADVNGQAEFGETALDYAVLFGRMGAALRLIDLGADPNLTDEQGNSALLRAANDCNYRVIEALLKKGAQVNQRDNFGRTPLIIAARSNCLRATAVILAEAKQPVEIETKDNSFRTALDYAEHPWLKEMLEFAADHRDQDPKTIPLVANLLE